MRNLFIMIIVAALLFSMAGCQESPEISTGATTTAPSVPAGVDKDYYFFQVGTVELIPGKPFDADALPEPVAVSQIPSCAFEGTDNVYTYEAFEIIAYEKAGVEYLYSVYILDPNLTTAHGLALGDPEARVDEIYGTDFLANGTERRYRKADTELAVILMNGTVQSIEIRMSGENHGN